MARPRKNADDETAAAAKPEKKTATAKKPSKAEVSVYLQMGSSEWDISSLQEKVMEAAAAGHKASEIKKLAVYLKPEDGKIYYAANEDITGSIDL